MKEQLTPEQICLSFLKAVEKADLKAKEAGKPRLDGHIGIWRDTYNYSREFGIEIITPNELREYKGLHKRINIYFRIRGSEVYSESMSFETEISQEETATRLLSMIKELEVYGIKLEEA